MIDSRTLSRYRLLSARKWFDTVPVRPAANLDAGLVRPGRKTGKRFDTLTRV